MNGRSPRFAIAYLIAVALSAAYGFAFPGDGDGLSFIPFTLLALPWSALLAMVIGVLGSEPAYGVRLGVICAGALSNALLIRRWSPRRSNPGPT